MASGQSKKRNKKSRNDKVTAPKMPKDKKNPTIEGKAFRPGQGGSWSAKVGKRDVRRITEGGQEKLRTRSDNYNSGSGVEVKVQKQKDTGRAADTRGIKNIGK